MNKLTPCYSFFFATFTKWKLVLLLALAFCSQGLFAQAKIPLAKECSSIKNPSKRAECFEAIVNAQADRKENTQAKTNAPPLAIIDPDDYSVEINNFLKEISQFSVRKDEFEKESDYWQRIKEGYRKYSGAEYNVIVPCNIAIKDGKQLVSYDAERGDVTLSLPEDQIGGVWQRNGKIAFPTLYYSFIPSKKPTKSEEVYQAENGFGAKIEVAKLEEVSNGIAIIAEGNNPIDTTSILLAGVDAYQRARSSIPKPGTFRFPVPAESARSLLQDCKVSFKVRTALDETHEMMTSGRKYITSLLLENKNEIKPTFRNPIHILMVHRALPVRLTSLEVISRTGQPVHKFDLGASKRDQ